MPIRFRINRDIRIQPQGLMGCFLTLLGVGALAAMAMILLLPVLGIALGIGLGLVLLGLAAVTYWRIRAWFRRLRGGGRGPEPKYEVQVLDLEDVPPNDDDGTDDGADEGGDGGDGGGGGDDGGGGPLPPPPHPKVEVRRRPPAP